MTARIKELEDLNRLRQFVVCTDSPTRAQWLTAVLRDQGVTVQFSGDVGAVPRVLSGARPHLIFVDFCVGLGESVSAQAIEIARAFGRSAPDLPLVAFGSAAQPGGTLAALRSGVRDFVDIGAPDVEVREIVSRLLEEADVRNAPPSSPPASGRQGRLVVLLGSRVGVGTTTLAAHLATMIRQNGDNAQTAAEAAGRKETERSVPNEDSASRVALLDLGLPVGDGLLYLNTAGTFHFAEAVRNLSRFDETLIRTALTPSSYDVPVLSLPRDLSEMRMITHADSLALLEQLRRYFDLLIADLGGFSSLDFVANMLRSADETWLVCDQSVGAIVSLADLLQDLKQRDVPLERLRLVVNRYDDRFGMAASQIAERFSLQLAGTIPERTLPLMRHANLGQLLVREAPQDPYMRATRSLATRLEQINGVSPAKHRPLWGRWRTSR